MPASQSSVAKGADAPGSQRGARSIPAWAKWLLWSVALAVGVGAGTGIAVLSRGTQVRPAAVTPRTPLEPAMTWAKGARRAPDFRLTDQNGKPLSLHSLRGRPVLVTFIDPLCRNLCPLEAQVLNDVVRRAAPGDRPTIAAVSVNPWGDAAQNMQQDAAKWKLVPQWRWGIAPRAVLARVWRDYDIGVRVAKRTVAGVTVREIAHTEATYLVDGSGHERAVFVYPFHAADVLRAVRKVGRGA